MNLTFLRDINLSSVSGLECVSRIWGPKKFQSDDDLHYVFIDEKNFGPIAYSGIREGKKKVKIGFDCGGKARVGGLLDRQHVYQWLQKQPNAVVVFWDDKVAEWEVS